MKLPGKVGLVTGAARGIGRATALELARHGADVVVSDILTTGEAEAVVQEIESVGRRSFFFCGDVADRASDERMFEETVRRLGRLDILVNNVAYSVRKPLLELEVADVERTWAVSLWAVFHCSQLAARQMVRQGQGGSIVIISSMQAERAFALSTAYNAAKAAVNHMAATWALELAPYRIRVNAIEPGWIDTPGERKFYTEQELAEAGKRAVGPSGPPRGNRQRSVVPGLRRGRLLRYRNQAGHRRRHPHALSWGMSRPSSVRHHNSTVSPGTGAVAARALIRSPGSISTVTSW